MICVPVYKVPEHAEGYDTNDCFENENGRKKEIEYLQRILQLLQQKTTACDQHKFLLTTTTGQHSAERTPLSHHIEIGTVSLPASEVG